MENHKESTSSEEPEKNDEDEILKYEIVNGIFKNNKIQISFSPTVQTLYEKNYFGTLMPDGSLELDILEALLLIERSRIQIFNENKEEMTAEQILSIVVEEDSRIWVRNNLGKIRFKLIQTKTHINRQINFVH